MARNRPCRGLIAKTASRRTYFVTLTFASWNPRIDLSHVARGRDQCHVARNTCSGDPRFYLGKRQSSSTVIGLVVDGSGAKVVRKPSRRTI